MCLVPRYPQNCFSPTQLKNFLARVQSTEPNCSIQVTHSSLCPGTATLAKEFSPHLWTEFTESIDVVGARKNRIESAQNISDVLEVSKNNIYAFVTNASHRSCYVRTRFALWTSRPAWPRRMNRVSPTQNTLFTN